MVHDANVAPGDIVVGFALSVPHTDDVCRSHMEDSMRRGLPDAVPRRHLTIIANGPSARGVDINDITTPTLALNGSLALFLEQGLEPTYWACCDPQALTAGFIPDNPPRSTIYFVAAKCHPALFQKLKGRDVRLWYTNDFRVPGHKGTALCSTVTLSGTWLMASMGYTDFDFYGWDGCFSGGQHHAGHPVAGLVPSLYLNYGGKVVNGEVIGGKNFETSRAWAAEAHGAEQLFQLAKYFDIGVTIHGEGMFKCAKEALDSMPPG